MEEPLTLTEEQATLVPLDDVDALKAQIEALQKQNQMLLQALLEAVGSTEAHANHVTRIFQSLGIRPDAQT